MINKYILNLHACTNKFLCVIRLTYHISYVRDSSSINNIKRDVNINILSVFYES